MNRFLIVALASTAALTMGATAATAQDITDVYKDRTVTILVGYGAGGTYGRTSLLLGKHFGAAIPGSPTMVVQHMPGAGGLKATNYFYNVAPKHGLNLLMPPEMTVVSALLRPEKVKFEVKEFTWLGRVFGQNTTLVVRRDSGIRSIKDLMTRKINVASSGKGSPTFLIPTLLNGLLGTKLKPVIGYRGSQKMQFAMEQGEVAGVALGWTAWISGRPQFFTGGDKSFALPLVQSGYTRQKGIEHIPLIRDLITDETDKNVARMLGSAGVLGRGLVLPPGAPRRLVQPLRTAFANVTKKKAFIKDALSRGLMVDPISGADIQKVINELMSMPKATVERARNLIFPKKS